MHENEIMVFLLATVVLMFVVCFRRQLSVLPSARWLFSSYCAAWLAWLATNVEHLFLPALFNFLEHLGYAVNGILLLVWCWLTMRKEVGNAPY